MLLCMLNDMKEIRQQFRDNVQSPVSQGRSRWVASDVCIFKFQNFPRQPGALSLFPAVSEKRVGEVLSEAHLGTQLPFITSRLPS